jgi:integrase
MKKLKVTILIRIRDNGKQRYCNPVWLNKKELKQSWAFVAPGRPEHHPEGSYALRYMFGGKQRWEGVGDNAGTALDTRKTREWQINNLDTLTELLKPSFAREEEQPKEEVKGKHEMAVEAARFLENVRLTKAPKTYQGYKYDLGLFRESCRKQYLEDIKEADIKAFIIYLRKRNLSDRTIFNTLEAVHKFLRENGVAGLARKNWPRYTEKAVEAYNEEDLKALFRVTVEDETVAFKFLLQSGCRDEELVYACWSDIDFIHKTFTVREKKDLGFTPKDKEERTIPLPDELLQILRERRRLYPDARLIFTNSLGGPEGHWLRILKEVAFHGGLNCGHCVNKKGLSCKDNPTCKKWILHRFRKTFATFHHESGVSARTLQAWLGHSDLETTLAYLQVADMRSARTRGQVNNTFAAIA